MLQPRQQGCPRRSVVRCNGDVIEHSGHDAAQVPQVRLTPRLIRFLPGPFEIAETDVERGGGLNEDAFGPDAAMRNSSPMKVLESEQTLFQDTLNGADPQRPCRRLAQDPGQATIGDELGGNVQLMAVCESIHEADNVRLRNTSALRHRGGGKVPLT